MPRGVLIALLMLAIGGGVLLLVRGPTTDTEPGAAPAPGAATSTPPAVPPAHPTLRGSAPGGKGAGVEAPPSAGSAPRSNTAAAPDPVVLSGRVIDVEGAPVPGATVLVSGDARRFRPDAPLGVTTAGPEGRFALRAPPGRLWIWARREGQVTPRGRVGDLPAGRRVEGLVLVLVACRNVRGTCLDARGAPVGGVAVRVEPPPLDASERFSEVEGLERFPMGRGETLSDEAGAFELTGIPRSAPWPWEAYHPYFRLAFGRIASDQDELTIRLSGGGGVRGLVLGADGAPVPRASVVLHALHRPARATRVEADGTFTLEGLEPSAGGFLRVTAPGLARHVEVLPAMEAEEVHEVTIHLAAGLDIAGRVVGEEGAPLAGVEVWATTPRASVPWVRGPTERRIPWSSAAGLGAIRSEEDGRFRLRELPRGSFTLRVADPARPEHVVEVEAEAGAEDVEIVLAAPDRGDDLRLEGRVVDGASGVPVPGFALEVRRARDGGFSRLVRRQVTHPDGAFGVGGLRPGRSSVRIDAEGYAPWISGWMELSAGMRPIEVRLLAPRSIRIRALDRAGEPLADWAVRLETLDGRPVEPERATRSFGSMLLLEKGEAAAEGLPAAVLRLVFVSPIVDGEHRSRTFEVDLREPVEGVLTFEIDR